MRLLGTGRLADVVNDLLADRGLVIVAGDKKLALALAARDRGPSPAAKRLGAEGNPELHVLGEREIAIAGGEERAAAKIDLRALRFDDGGRLDLDSGAAAGAVIAGAARDSEKAERLAELIRVVAADRIIVLLDRVARVEASRCALLAGLSRLEQRVVSRTVVTAGVVTPG